MIRVLFCLILSSSLFGAHLRISKIVPDLNLYILEDQYVLKVSSMIPRLNRGDLLDMNIEWFHEKKSWKQKWGFIFNEEVMKCDYKFSPVGKVKSKPVSLEKVQTMFRASIDLYPIKVYNSVYHNRDIFNRKKASDYHDFDKRGVEVSFSWVVDKLKSFGEKMKHSIYEVYHPVYPEKLTALIVLSRERSVFISTLVEFK